jgi:hypothetical protein
MRARLLCCALLASGGAVVLSATAVGAIPVPGPPPGAAVARDASPCAEHGGFRALGTFGSSSLHDIGINDKGSNGRPGATSWMFPSDTGSTTGGNNNSICGGGNVPPAFLP